MYRWPTVIPCVYAYTVILQAIYIPNFFQYKQNVHGATQKEVLSSGVGTKDSKHSQ